MPEVFNNRKKEYISNSAPVSAGTELIFSNLIHKDCNCKSCRMYICKDNEQEFSIQMNFAGDYDNDYQKFSCCFTPDFSGLYWYRFEFDCNGENKKIFKGEQLQDSGAAVISDSGKPWQLTVFDEGFTTPNNFKRGTIYQIFPDRFCNSGEKKDNVPQDRFIVDDWYIQPAYEQNCGLRSLCNDYYGGDLKGIEQKIPYLKDLGITIIYLNPIFESHSNHRYNTADYLKIDPLLGTQEDFVSLCKTAHKFDIKIILDGVFSHTGSDSVYFNKYMRYGDNGAFNKQSSPYYQWYKFFAWPGGYHSWWGIASLPEVIEENPSFMDFICSENGVLRHWMKLGADGWRLDVADELPDVFIDRIRCAIKEENPDALLMGEVWEDASNKISHGGRRRFLQGKQLDSVMNYPLRNAIIKFVMGGDAYELNNTVCDILCNYPKQVVDVMMNHLGTHDTERILSVLGGADLSLNRIQQAKVKLTEQQTDLALKRLKLASVLQYTLPGIPSLYYADEAQTEGLRDPFNRTGFPWGKENKQLVEFFKKLGKLRLENDAFCGGEYECINAGLGTVCYLRKKDKNEVLIAVNRWTQSDGITVPDGFNKVYFGQKPENNILILPPMSATVLIKE